MIRGTVVGQVWATRKARGLDGRKLLLVAARDADGQPSGRLVVAIDMLDARGGEDVTVAFGSGARNVLRPGAGEPRPAVRRRGGGHRRRGGLMFLGTRGGDRSGRR